MANDASAPAGGPRGLRGWRRALRRLIESRAVELTSRELAETAAVFAPHPDDETLGCGGTILRKRAAGADVTVVFLTDGRQSHAAHTDVEKLVARRRQEGRAAARALGIADSAVHFLDYLDGSLAEQRSAAIERVRALLSDLHPAQIFVTSHWETTADHQAARDIVWAAAAEACPDAARFEYLVWFWAHWPWATRADLPDRRIGAFLGQTGRRLAALLRAPLVRVRIREVWPAKWAALAEHGSQMRRPAGDETWPILADVWRGGFLDCAFADCEIFVRQ
jgi:LmbE family N-acetylglucosaminyl deacetylase